MYSLKLITSISSAALNLYRGITNYPIFSRNEKTLDNFVRDINHPGPSISTVQKWLPSESHENEQFHPHHLLFHLKVLSKQCKSL